MLGSSINQYTSKSESKKEVTVVYILFACLALLVYHLLAEGEFSSILTLSAIFQTLAFSLLAVQVLASGNINGISTSTLQLEALSIACRLSSTTWLEGYIPSDMTGDYLYQAFDFMSLAAAFLMLYQLKRARPICEAQDDEVRSTPLAVVCFGFACLFHPDLNDTPLFDSLWMCSLNLGAVAALPQLWMMAKRKSSIQSLTAHFVGVMGFSRFLIGLYMWHGYEEITCDPCWLPGAVNHAGYAVLAACAIHTLVIGDFFYYYVRNLATSGLDSQLPLYEVWTV